MANTTVVVCGKQTFIGYVDVTGHVHVPAPKPQGVRVQEHITFWGTRQPAIQVWEDPQAEKRRGVLVRLTGRGLINMRVQSRVGGVSKAT